MMQECEIGRQSVRGYEELCEVMKECVEAMREGVRGCKTEVGKESEGSGKEVCEVMRM